MAKRPASALRFALLLASAVASLPAAAAPTRILDGEVVAIVEQQVEACADWGYAPVWVDLQNNAAYPNAVTLEFRGLVNRTRVTREVRLDGGERRVVTLPVPVVTRVGQLTVKAPNGHATEQVTFRDVRTGRITLLGTSETFTRLAGLTNRTSDEDAWSTGHELRVRTIGRRQFPEIAAALHGTSAVVIADRSGRELDPSQRAALEQYVLAGGLLVYAGEAVTERVADALEIGPRVSPGATVAHGFGHVHACRDDRACGEVLRAQLSLRSAPAPFGAHDPYGDEAFDDDAFEDDAFDRPAAEFAIASDRPERLVRSEPAIVLAGPQLLTGVGRPPVAAFLLIILAFVLAVGPGSVWVVRRWGRPFMLVSVPALSLVTCSGIAGWGVASDGLFTVHAATRSVTRLDAEGGRAVTLAYTSYFAALSPGTFELPAGTFVQLPMPSLTNRLTLDWTGGLQLRGDLVPSRTARDVSLVSVAPTRARLVLASDGISIDNALGGPISRVAANLDGRLVAAADVADGARAVLSPEPDALDPFVTSDALSPFNPRIAAQMRAELAPGEFLAELSAWEGAPGVVAKVQAHGSRHWIRGRLAR